jgi:hypothetical protein
MINDKTAVYIKAVYPCFEDLKQASSQLAGLLVLNNLDPELRRSAEEALQRAMDGLLVAVPARAKEHHGHLMRAAAAVRQSLRTQHDPLPFLKDAHAHLRAAGRSLPGFEMIDLNHACCSAASRGHGHGADAHA